MDEKVKAINEIQAAESEAKLILEAARKERERRLIEAQEKAKDILDQATSDANELTEEILKNADKEIEQLRKKHVESAKKTADKLKKASLGKAKMDKLAEQAVKEIIGA